MLEKVNIPSDIKGFSIDELNVLARDIRQVILDTVMENGGHLASSLGAVETIIAMHYCFNAPHDKFVFDVGHQCYAHKLLTGRVEEFATLRKKDGMAGFPKKEESEYDVVNTGHASTSLSIACGLSRALANASSDAIAVSLIGDGALTGGLAFEALNDSVTVNKKQIIILNDNSMSISANVGSTAKYLLKLHTSNTYNNFKSKAYGIVKGVKIDGVAKSMKFLYKAKNSIKYFLQGGMPFEQFGLRYYGPLDGHNLSELIFAFNAAYEDNESCILHIVTKKGYGFLEAEENPAKFHGYSPSKKSSAQTFSSAFGESMKYIASKNEKIFAVTAAMREGTGLECYAEMFPERFSDVGIAEGHAATMSAGLALCGYKPYFAVYSSFLQRAYDSVIHDVCMQDLPVTFCIDRAGIVPDDGETHQGIYDLNFLRLVPNIAVLCPKNTAELDAMIKWSIDYMHPLAIRYPKGSNNVTSKVKPIVLGEWDVICEAESNLIILATGAKMVEVGGDIVDILAKKHIKATFVNARFVKPMDEKYLLTLSGKTVVTLEDNVLAGGFGSSVLEFFNRVEMNVNVACFGINDEMLTHATVNELLVMTGLDAETLANKIEAKYKKHKK